MPDGAALCIGGLGATAGGKPPGTRHLSERIASELDIPSHWHEHDDNPKLIARLTAGMDPLVIVAHSWGVPKALKVARIRWKRHGRSTAYLATIDGVAFFKWWGALFGAFKLPRHISCGRAFRQVLDHPRGRGLRPAWRTDPDRIREEVVLRIPHNAMDDSHLVHDVILRDLRHIL